MDQARTNVLVDQTRRYSNHLDQIERLLKREKDES